MPNHKFYFDANLIHFFGILKYIKRQQLISITICSKKSLFRHFLQKIQFVNFEFSIERGIICKKNEETQNFESPRTIDIERYYLLYQEC